MVLGVQGGWGRVPDLTLQQTSHLGHSRNPCLISSQCHLPQSQGPQEALFLWGDK